MSNVIHLPTEEYDLLKYGRKRVFIRTPSTRLNVKIFDWIPVVFKDLPDNNMLIEIQDITFCTFNELSMKDAIAAGHINVGDLKKDLQSRYPTLENNSRLYLYYFEVMGTCEKVVEGD